MCDVSVSNPPRGAVSLYKVRVQQWNLQEFFERFSKFFRGIFATLFEVGNVLFDENTVRLSMLILQRKLINDEL